MAGAVSQGNSVRLPVLPRDVAGAVTVFAVARGAWAIAAVALFLTIPGTFLLLAVHGDPVTAIVPCLVLAVMLGALIAAVRRPTTSSLLSYVLLGAACVYIYQLAILGEHPEIQLDAIYVLNRPALALVLVGTATASTMDAARWGIAGYLAGTLATVAACIQLDLPILTGFGPSIALVDYCAVFLAVGLIQQAGRGRMPDLAGLQEDTRRIQAQRSSDERAAALVHDTVLNDLSLVLSAPSVLDERTRARLRDDVDTLTRPDWSGESAFERVRGGEDAAFRGAVHSLASDFQWRGLSVDVSIDPEAKLLITPAAAAAALGAARACLENCLKHSGAASAELVVGVRGGAVTLMVIDAGRGFNAADIGADRLGVRSSIVQRVQGVGGAAKVWSMPGHGTSVLLTIPLVLDE